MLHIIYQLEFLFHQNSIYDLDYSCVNYIMFVSCYKKSCRSWVLAPCSADLQSFCMFNINEPVPPILAKYSVPEWCNLSSTTFIFSCCRLMDNPHSPITNVHVIIIASSSLVRTPPSPNFLDLVFPFRWLEMEHIEMFHALLALHRENDPFSIASIVNSKVSSI